MQVFDPSRRRMTSGRRSTLAAGCEFPQPQSEPQNPAASKAGDFWLVDVPPIFLPPRGFHSFRCPKKTIHHHFLEAGDLNDI